MDAKKVIRDARIRLREDFEFYAPRCVKIRPKASTGVTVPLTLNVPQTKLHEVIEAQYAKTKRVRVIILKARQQGFSTYVSGRIYFRLSQHRAKKGLVVAHVADSTRSLFDMYRNIHKEMPAAVKPSTKYSSRRELVFENLGTGLQVATAGGDGIARGETLSHVHLSEVAFWPSINAAQNFNGLLQAVPSADDTEVFVESTANGMSGVFYELWKGAVLGENEFIPFFSPWFDSPEYIDDVPEGFEKTYEEHDLVEKYGLTDGQLMFRRRKIGATSRELFMQEYPSCADEAFITSGRPVFNPEQIHEMLKICPEPVSRMEVFEGAVQEHSRGELLVYHPHDAAQVYTIGADVGMGVRNGDFSVAQVLDGDLRQVAVWRARIHPDKFADVLKALGLYYNTALIAPEANNHGLLTAVRLGRDLAYPRVFTEVTEGKLTDDESISIGFHTTARTKPLVIDRLRAVCRERLIQINDRRTLQEMLSYIVTESGKMEAEGSSMSRSTGNDDKPGCHDDCVMSLAIANHVHERKFSPIEVTDDYYITAI